MSVPIFVYHLIDDNAYKYIKATIRQLEARSEKYIPISAYSDSLKVIRAGLYLWEGEFTSKIPFITSYPPNCRYKWRDFRELFIEELKQALYFLERSQNKDDVLSQKFWQLKDSQITAMKLINNTYSDCQFSTSIKIDIFDKLYDVGLRGGSLNNYPPYINFTTAPFTKMAVYKALEELHGPIDSSIILVEDTIDDEVTLDMT